VIRQLIGAALAASLLHLNVERADLVCATHHERPEAAPAQPEHPHGGHHNAPHAAGDHAASSAESCETPAQPDCCQALVSCSTLLGLDDAGSLSAPAEPHDVTVAALQNRPASRNTAPEPPPPKA
jgi:predicted NBD/HSP70 family sugar kinase